ncbi:DUF87 domain-containing protein [Candidatus Bathyarchaeota archaeon]|nr:DUF87 domain-containing protein [Candidatus Bathyarchaeota archaeon]
MSSGPNNKRYVNPTVPLEELFKDFMPEVSEPLEILCDDDIFAVVIGRTERLHEKAGLSGTLFSGIICERNSEHFGKKVLIDALNPHKIFISGKTGSGKSYTLGVIAEELAEQSLGLGTIIVDPMGAFWSMKYSKKPGEDELLERWGLSPKAFDNIKVFVPVELSEHYTPGTYDDVFSIRPDELGAEDWANTFGLDYFRSLQSALIIELVRVLNESKVGYSQTAAYSIADMLELVEDSPEIQEKFQSNTVRAVKTRLESASHWGVFSTVGTSLQSLSVPNQVSVIDVSLLPDNTRGLVVGLLAKKILNERTRIARQDKMRVMTDGGGTVDETQIPVTWLMVDEAHTLVPSKGKTAASEPLIEYAKRGRMPGCALVLATQQPAATSDEILSQIDILISHNLSYSQDILELRKRTPSKLPPEIGGEAFIRNLPVGAALIADQTTSTKRAFVARIRPRRSEHGGKAVLPKHEAKAPRAMASPMPPDVVPREVPKPEPMLEAAEPKMEARAKPPVKPVKRVEITVPDVTVQTFDILDDMAVSYAIRFMNFRVMNKELNLTKASVSAQALPGTTLAPLRVFAERLGEKGFSLTSTRVVDKNPLLVFNRDESVVALSVIFTKKSTVLVVLSAGPEGHLDA